MRGGGGEMQEERDPSYGRDNQFYIRMGCGEEKTVSLKHSKESGGIGLIHVRGT